MAKGPKIGLPRSGFVHSIVITNCEGGSRRQFSFFYSSKATIFDTLIGH
jgi:hypothetical protein